jgi:hypothetical protein
VCPTEALVFEDNDGGAVERRLTAMSETRRNLLKKGAQ